MVGMQMHSRATLISMLDQMMMFVWSQVGFLVEAKWTRECRRMMETTVTLEKD